MMKGSVMVIGSGIAGINSALELMSQGFKVVLVEKKPTLGGRMTQLDKMFPTNECGMCTILPKLLEVTSNPNIQIMAWCDVKKVEGEAGDFKVTVLKKPRYIDPMKCNACTECFPACPVGGVPMEFNFGRGASKAISFYSPFPPRKAIIYPDHCSYLKDGKCGDGEKPPCVEACKPDAIRLDQKPTEVEVNVGAIIVATGLEEYLPNDLKRFGYSEFKNVVTSIEYERLLSGIGPTGGNVKRADGTQPKRVAWIQCVGQKDLPRGATYCSKVCCMAATTEAVGTLERDRDSQVYVIHNDIVGYAKGFQEHYREAMDEGVNYVRGIVEDVQEKDNGDLIIKFKNPDGSQDSLTVNMLVLSTNLIPNKDNSEMADIIGIELDSQGFIKEKDHIFDPLRTTKEGVFVAGTAQGPKDISESIAQACGAAAGAATLLKEAKDTETVKPPELKLKDVPADEEAKIGVMFCDCGKNIAGFIDVEAAMDYTRTLPNVSVVERDLFACGGAAYKKMIQDSDINRTVVVACSPKTHEHLFQLHTQNAGLNKYLMEMVNARNHCTWVHSTDKDKATEKTKKLIKMGVAKARLLEQLDTIKTPIEQSSLIIGGGVTGLVCANRLSEMGYKVHLVEKGNELGGKTGKLTKAFSTDKSPKEFVSGLVQKIESDPNITVHKNVNINGVAGFIGQFKIGLSGSEEAVLDVGTIVVATGARDSVPKGLYSYGCSDKVITHSELEKKLGDGSLDLGSGKIVMISCAGAKEPGQDNKNSYCCNVGCSYILKNSKEILKKFPDSKITILHQDWVLPNKLGEKERLDLIENENMNFIRYSEGSQPKVDGANIEVTNADTNAGQTLEADLVVLTTPMTAPEHNNALKDMLGVCMEENNYFMGALGKLKPLDFTTDGIFLAGTAHSPKGLEELVADGEGAASRVADVITKDVMQKEPITSFVVDENCDGCAYCVDPCTFGAITLLEYNFKGDVKKTVEVNEAICKGCGVCMATCPKKGIYIQNYKPEMFNAMVDAALGVDE